MKRPLIIILGIIIILILIGIWVYVLLSGSNNQAEDQFGGFEFGDTTDPNAGQFIEQEQTQDEPVVNVADRKALRQLTTKPVIGYAEVLRTASSTPEVQYVEAGTGHIYGINLETGEETRLSATTIPLARQAAVTPNGRHVLIQAGEGGQKEFIVGTLATSSDDLSNFALSENIISFTATNENELLYAVGNGNNTTVKAYNPSSNATRVLFTIPFREVAIDWHHTAGGPHIVYPKANSRLEGFVYSYTNGAMTRLPLQGFGLSAAGGDEYVIASRVLGTGDYQTTAYDRQTNKLNNLPISVIPEKCATSPRDTALLFCGASLTEYSDRMPDTWYRGSITLTDSIWSVRPQSGSASLMASIQNLSGRSVDIVNPAFNPIGTRFFFQNKIDRTLWVYDLTI